MAHKTFSKEQFKILYYFFKISFLSILDISHFTIFKKLKKNCSILSSYFFFFLIKKNFFNFETNIFFLKNFFFFMKITDLKFFTIKNN
jgi:hypothetical protein